MASRTVVLPVVDPSLSPKERRRLLREAESPRVWLYWDLIERSGQVLSALCLISLTILHFVIGLSWWWMLVSLVPVVAGYIISYLILDSNPYAHCFNQIVRPRELDEPRIKLLVRAQKSIGDSLQSEAAGELGDRAVSEKMLRLHEWDIAIQCREISTRHAELAGSAGNGTPGPRTAAVLDSQRRALAQVEAATTSRIRELERYARQLQAADAAKHDWLQAQQASRRNDQYYDLVASTVRDEHAVEELREMTQQTAAAAQAFQDTLDQAGMAAEVLILPTTPPELNR